MDFKSLVIILFYVNLTLAIHVSTNTLPSSDENSYSDEDLIEELDDETLQREVKDTRVKTNAPLKIVSNYEVTEIVVDVPNTTPAPGVANSNYALNKPLNPANPLNQANPLNPAIPLIPVNNNGNIAENGLSEEEKIYRQLENNYFSILQIIQAHQNGADHEEIVELPQFLKFFKQYLDGLRQGFLHGVHNTRKDVETEVEDPDVESFLSGPFSYIKKLFKRRN